MGDGKPELVRIVSETPGIPAAELAARLGVGERTVRTYVRRINEALGDAGHLEHRRGQGYFLVTEDADALSCALTVTGHSGELPVTPEERVSYLLENLLTRVSWVTVDEIASTIYVSRASVSGDLKVVEDTLSRFGLTLERRPRYGIRVTGPEVARRLALASLAVGDTSSMAGARPTMVRVASCVDEVCREKGFVVSSAAYHNLIVHVAVAVRRMGEGGYVPMLSETVEGLRSLDAWSVACSLADALSSEFDIAFPEAEIAYLALHLAGRQVLGENPGSGTVISDETWAVVGEMLDVVEGSFAMDFHGDLELRMNLARHVGPLAIRLRHHMRVENPLLSEVMERYPVAYSMAREASAVLAGAYGEFPSDEEVGYIALSFILAMERMESEPAKKNVLVVCASGQGTAKLLEWRYRRDFGPWLSRIKTCDVAHLDTVDLTDFDYVFTTVPLGRTLPVPVREVRFFLDDDEVACVRQLLSGLGERPEAAEYFSPGLFMPHLACSGRAEALDVLCECVAQTQEVEGDLRELVEKREQLAQTSFGNLVAMPHPARPVVGRTCVAVGLLDAPVEWNGHPVQAVFLVCIARDHAGKLDGFYRTMARLMGNKSQVKRLVDSQDYQTLLTLLKESEDGRKAR